MNTNPIRYSSQAGVVTLCMDWPDSAVNKIDALFMPALRATVDRLEAEANELVGVIWTSAKKTFFAGADLNRLLALQEHDRPQLFEEAEAIKDLLRRLERLGKPVVAALTGSALGGGWELALACHHRFCLDRSSIQLGLPEVTLGLMPGAGGVVRMVRMLGLQTALPLLLEGQQLKPAEAAKFGLVELATSEADMLAAAHAWIAAHADVQQPWDTKGYRVPGGDLNSPKVTQLLSVAPAMLVAKTQGVYPAPKAILSAAAESLAVDFETATRIESRYFVELATSQIAKNMISTLFFQLGDLRSGASRPPVATAQPFSKVGILGAGMMGSGIAYANAARGIPCVLKDVNLAAAQRGHDYSRKVTDKLVARGRLSAEQQAQLLQRIHPTADGQDLSGCDLIIEAVFENRELKAQVTKESEPLLQTGGVFASNTSTLPISQLAESSARPANFVGLHFFSPVDKMQLVEIIKGEETSLETLARAYDYVLALGKTPIVVNDSRGFYTSRIIGRLLTEAVGMIEEGVPAPMIERASLMAGFPVSLLALQDELNMKLALHISAEARSATEASGGEQPETPAERVMKRMVALGRSGRSEGAGFYDYKDNARGHLWSGLHDLARQDLPAIDIQTLVDRFLFVQAVDSARCLEEGVIKHERDANIGSILGIGFPAWTGGALQFIRHYGPARFVARAGQLAAQYGERFLPPESLLHRAANDTF